MTVAESIFNEGMKHYGKQNYVKAVKFLQQAADMGYAPAQSNLGMCYFFGQGVIKDEKKSFNWYEKAARQGLANAQNVLAVLYLEAVGVERDNYKAVEWLEKAAAQGHKKADELLKTVKASLKQIKESAPDSDYGAKNNSAMQLYDTGWEFMDEGKSAEAAECWAKAADMGDAAAQYECALFLLGEHDDRLDKDDYDDYYDDEDNDDIKAAGVSEPRAINERDYAAAVKCFEKAAAQGHIGAQFKLAGCYFEGLGITRDYAKAVKWLKKAAAQGHTEAQYILAECYFEGRGETQDYQKAVRWFENAATQGHIEAQRRLAGCYYAGNGVVQSKEKALEWMGKADSQERETPREFHRYLNKCNFCRSDAVCLAADLPRLSEKVKLCAHCFEIAKNPYGALKLSAHFSGREHVDMRDMALHWEMLNEMDRDTLSRYMDELEAELKEAGSDEPVLTVPRRYIDDYKRAIHAVESPAAPAAPPAAPAKTPPDRRSAAESLLKARQSGPPTVTPAAPVPQNVITHPRHDVQNAPGGRNEEVKDNAKQAGPKPESGVKPRKKLKTVLIGIGLTVLVLAGTLTGIIIGVAGGRKGLTYQAYENGYMVTGAGKNFSEADLVIPSAHGGKPVVAIGGEAFTGGTMKSVFIPASVKYIGEGAFSDCKELEKAVFAEGFDPDGLDGAIFSGCSGLNEAVLPGSMRILGDTMFAGTDLEYIDLPAVTAVPYRAFYNCTRLRAVYIKAGCGSVGSGAFEGCAGLKEVYYSGTADQWKKVSGAGKAAVDFEDGDTGRNTITDVMAVDFAQKLMYGDAPDGTGYAAYGSWSLFDRQSVVIPPEYGGKAVTAVGYTAFLFCDTLREITLPSTIKLIREYAFYGCDSLVKVKSGVTLSSINVEVGNDILYSVDWAAA